MSLSSMPPPTFPARLSRLWKKNSLALLSPLLKWSFLETLRSSEPRTPSCLMQPLTSETTPGRRLLRWQTLLPPAPDLYRSADWP